MPVPYKLILDCEGFYSFTTDHNLIYSIFLIDTTELFGIDPEKGCLLFHFGLTLETEVDLIPNDKKVELTVLQFVTDTLSAKSNRNCILYAGSRQGNKHHLRIRLFEWWFVRGKPKLSNIEKYVRKTNGIAESVLLVNSGNPHKEEIISIFLK